MEYAARADTTTTYPWGEDVTPDGRLMANTWQGRFPFLNEGALGWIGTSPVGAFPPNGFGLVDMIGNVWEWTTTEFSGPPQARREQGVLHAGPDGRPRGESDPQGRIASVRAGVLPPVSACGALASVSGDQCDDSHRVPLRGRSVAVSVGDAHRGHCG